MTPVLSCQVCKNRGYIGERRCPNCRGFACLLFVGQNAVGWRRPLDPFSIGVRKTAVAVNRLIDILLLAVGFLSAANILYGWFLGMSIDWENLVNAKSGALLFFWFGMFCLFLLIARRRARKAGIGHLPRLLYGETAPAVSTPPGWETFNRFPAKNMIDASAAFSAAAVSAVERAVKIVDQAGHATVGKMHLLLALLDDRDIRVLFARAGVGTTGIAERAGHFLEQAPLIEGRAELAVDADVQTFLLNAYAQALLARGERVETADLLFVISDDPAVEEILSDVGITPDIIHNVVAWVRQDLAFRAYLKHYRGSAALKPKGGLDRAMTAVATPALNSFSHDLTRAARYGQLPFLVDREIEMNAIFRAIEGGRASVVIVGEAGVGKDTVLAGIAERMVEEDVPAILQDKRLMSLSVPDLVAGAAPEDVGERLLTVLDEIARARNIVLAIEDIDALAGVSAGGVDLSDVFATELSRGYFFCIATASALRYKKLENRPLANVLERVDMPEPDANTSIQILMHVAGGIEAEQNVFFTYPAIERAVSLSSRYMHDRFLPGKAVEILREAAQHARQNKGEKSLVDGEDVAVIVSAKAHVPVTAVTSGEREKLLNLEEELHKRLIGQNEAVSAVSAALRRARAELRAKNRPIAAFMFLGPTGVGKTELAKTISQVYFGDEKNMIRLDMSEYQQPESINRLIGVPGESGGGLLTEAMRKQPFALLLLDEFEKASPDILNVFLQVMEDGRLTDNEGRTVDFTNAIIVATSNAGSQYIQDSMRAGVSVDDVKKGLLNTELKGIFKPELLNRFDGVIVFKPLTADEIEQVAWLMIGRLTDEFEARGITFRATDEAVRELASVGFDPVFGARPMRRAIQEKVENALAEALLKQEISRRDTVVLDPGGVIRVEKGKKL